jgi:hypothetical protein
MNKPAILFVLALLAVPVFAVNCTQNYNTCIAQCCNLCGSTLTNNSNGSVASCNVGTLDNPKQECIMACMPCSNSYITCIAGQDVPFSTTGTGCCASAFVLLAGLGFAIRGNIR